MSAPRVRPQTVQGIDIVKQLIAFDLDGTLAESKQKIGDEMAGLLDQLLARVSVAVISSTLR